MQHGVRPPCRGDERATAEKLAQLTEAERVVLAALARTGRIDDVVVELGRSKNTINNHLKSARLKLGGTDSLSVARMYVASQHSQSVASHPLAMADEPVSAAPIVSPDCPEGEGATSTMLREDRSIFDTSQISPISLITRFEGKLHELSWFQLVTLSALLTAALCVVLVSTLPMHDSFERIAGYVRKHHP